MLKKIALGLLASTLLFTLGCGDEKKPEPKKEAPKPATTTQAPAKKEKIKLYTDEQLKKMTPAERAKARKEEYRANMDPAERRAHLASDKPEHQKFVKMNNDKYPHLKWGSTGYNWKKVEVDGEAIWNYRRITAGKDRPKFTDDKGRQLEGTEEYNIRVLYGACKGQCVIEATDEHIIKLDAATYKNPKIEKSTIVPFDKTYIRHNENGKKWVTHEKCGTK